MVMLIVALALSLAMPPVATARRGVGFALSGEDDSWRLVARDGEVARYELVVEGHSVLGASRVTDREAEWMTRPFWRGPPLARRFGSSELCTTPGLDAWSVEGEALVPVTRCRGERGETLEIDGVTGALRRSFVEQAAYTGVARLYRENAVASIAEGPIAVELPDLGDGRRLDGTFLRTLSCEDGEASFELCALTLEGVDGDFSVDLLDPGYDEANTYAIASKVLRHLRGLMPPDATPERRNFGLGTGLKLDFMVRARLDAGDGLLSPDVAVYRPQGVGNSGTPVVVLGRGYEPGDAESAGRLRALAKDGDVVAHETFHHAIYRYLGLEYYQARSLAEAFADYLTASLTGNPQIGEAAAAFGQANVRRIDGTTSIASAQLIDLYSASTIFASALWEIRTRAGVDGAGRAWGDLAAWRALERLPRNATFYQAATAYLTSITALETELGLQPGRLAGIAAAATASFVARAIFASPTADPATGFPPEGPALVAKGLGSPTPEPAFTPGTKAPQLAPDREGSQVDVVQKRAPCGVLGLESHGDGVALVLAMLAPIILARRRRQ